MHPELRACVARWPGFLRDLAGDPSGLQRRPGRRMHPYAVEMREVRMNISASARRASRPIGRVAPNYCLVIVCARAEAVPGLPQHDVLLDLR